MTVDPSLDSFEAVDLRSMWLSNKVIRVRFDPFFEI